MGVLGWAACGVGCPPRGRCGQCVWVVVGKSGHGGVEEGDAAWVLPMGVLGWTACGVGCLPRVLTFVVFLLCSAYLLAYFHPGYGLCSL